MKLLITVLLVYTKLSDLKIQNNSNNEIKKLTTFSLLSNISFPWNSTDNINLSTPVSRILMSSSIKPLSNKSIELYEVNETYYSVDFLNDISLFNYWMTVDGFIDIIPKVLNSISLKHIALKFNFVFYGHNLNSVIVTSAGFIYMSDFLHQYMTFSQYIAPFMVQLPGKQETKGIIKYKSTENYFQVMWKNMAFYYESNGDKHKNVTFSCVLMKNGSIIFIYDQLPVLISASVIIGLSDAFYEDFEALNLRRIVLYSKISILKPLTQRLIIKFSPKILCNQLKSCQKCLKAEEMKCQWCSSLNHCSNGYDRLRQKWLNEKCQVTSVQLIKTCYNQTISSGIILTITSLLIVILIVILVFIVFKKYKDPTTAIGRFLIENRPSNIQERFSKIRFRNDIPYSVTL